MSSFLFGALMTFLELGMQRKLNSEIAQIHIYHAQLSEFNKRFLTPDMCKATVFIVPTAFLSIKKFTWHLFIFFGLLKKKT